MVERKIARDVGQQRILSSEIFYSVLGTSKKKKADVHVLRIVSSGGGDINLSSKGREGGGRDTELC